MALRLHIRDLGQEYNKTEARKPSPKFVNVVDLVRRLKGAQSMVEHVTGHGSQRDS
jgi:hypothetical protein